MTTDQRVYKVLNNNGGTAAYSNAEPTSTNTTPFASGGYILKYMYTITASETTKFLTNDYMPVSTDTTISPAAVDGKIESLAITNGSITQTEHITLQCLEMVQIKELQHNAIVRITVSIMQFKTLV